MSMDPQQPYQQYQQVTPPTQGRWGTSTLGNIGAEIMGGLVYLLSILSVVGFVGQIVIFAMEKNRFVKFHAAQAMLLGIVSVILSGLYFFILVPMQVVSSSGNGLASASGLGIAAILGCVIGLVGLVLFGFWIWAMIAAFTGKPTKLPVIGNIAEGLAGGPVSAV